MSEEAEDNAFENPYPDYDGVTNIYDFDADKLPAEIEAPLVKHVLKYLDKLESTARWELDPSDFSVYTGTAGLSLMYLRLIDIDQCNKRFDYLDRGIQSVEPVLCMLKKNKPSFLNGFTGPIALTSVFLNMAGQSERSIQLARSIEALAPELCKVPCVGLPDELLNGRVGYLFSLLFLEKYLGEDESRSSVIKEVVDAVIKSGQRKVHKTSNVKKMPLFYMWHDRGYIGMAHGMAGIMYMLLQARKYVSKEQMDMFVKPTIDGLLDLQFPSGNYASSFEKNSDKFVQWCHGAPGVLHLMLLAYQVFEDEKYLKSAQLSGELIWKKGLLKKGYGLCHGASGNGYAHLRLFQVTKDLKYLHRALKFAEWCFEYGERGCRVPDRSLSLYEGLAGAIYFLMDLISPMKSAFPAFQLF